MATPTYSYLQKSEAVLKYTNDKRKFAKPYEGVTQKTVLKSVANNLNYITWFDSKNQEPLKLLNLLLENNIAIPILTTKARFIAGKGIITYVEKVDDAGKKSLVVLQIPEIAKFLKDNNIAEIFFNAAKDIQILGNGFIEGIWSRDGKKVVGLHHRDSTYARLGERNKKGYSDYIYLCGDWKNPILKGDDNDNVVAVRSYIPFDQTWDTSEEITSWKNAMQPSMMFHLKDYMPGFPNYSPPCWFGTKDWIELANLIPIWHKEGIKNGWNIRFLIEVSDAYFDGVPPEELNREREALQKAIDDCLAGEKNVSKSMFFPMPHNLFTDKGVIRITPVPFDLHDDAFTTLFTHSNTATTSGFTLPPALAGIEQSGGISSGAEMEHAYNIWIHGHAPQYRTPLIDVLNKIAKINGWDVAYPGLTFGVENIELTTLDKNPTGIQNTIA
jgi:hypothetical protein